MYKKNKSVKLQLKHLNDCYNVFEHYCENQNISKDKDKFINILLTNYINSSEIISEDTILEIKEINATKTTRTTN